MAQFAVYYVTGFKKGAKRAGNGCGRSWNRSGNRAHTSFAARTVIEGKMIEGNKIMNIKNIKLRKSQGGFTLIELVVVLVILAILAAVAVPIFVDLRADAQVATCDGIGGALVSTAGILVASPDFPIATPEIGTGGTLAEIAAQSNLSGATATPHDTACAILVDLDADGHECVFEGTAADGKTIPDSLSSDPNC